MDKLSICRICLNKNVHHIPESIQLQEMYEKLTAIPFQTSDMRPLSLCVICQAQLKATRRLMLRCLKAEELLTQMLSHLTNEDKPQTPILIDRSALKQLSISPVEQTIIDSTVQNIDIKVEIDIPTYSEEEVKSEPESTEDLRETANSNSEADHDQRLSDSEDDIPLNNIEREKDTVREQKAVKVGSKEPNRSEKGACITKNRSQFDAELKKYVKDMTYVNADPPKNVTINTINNDVMRDSLKCHDKCTTENDSGQDSIMCQRDIVEKYNLNYDANNFVCDVCNESFNRKDHLISHARKHTGQKPYVCSVCNKRFTYGSSLAQHALIHTGEKPYPCNECNKSFNKKSNLTKHALIHTGEKSYVCNVCNKKFGEKRHLKRHASIHSDERPYVCDVCNKSFSQKSTLTLHARSHTGDRPYACDVCNKSYTVKRHLTVHARLHSGERPYVCNVCNKSFTEKKNLTNHARIHTGEKPYACNFCTKRFTQKAHLTTHARIHSGEKPYTCNVCGKGFNQKWVLRAHSVKHTDEKPYVCHICGMELGLFSSLKVHLKKHM